MSRSGVWIVLQGSLIILETYIFCNVVRIREYPWYLRLQVCEVESIIKEILYQKIIDDTSSLVAQLVGISKNQNQILMTLKNTFSETRTLFIDKSLNTVKCLSRLNNLPYFWWRRQKSVSVLQKRVEALWSTAPGLLLFFFFFHFKFLERYPWLSKCLFKVRTIW